MRIRMKSAILLILSAMAVVTLSSCSFLWPQDQSSEKRSISTKKEQKKIATSILKAFDEQDNEALKDLFCERSKALPDLDEQIQAAMDFYEGKMISCDDITGTSEEQSWELGVVTRVSTGGHIRYIETDTEKRYTIAFLNHLVNNKHPDKVGISKLTIMYGDIYDEDRSGEEVIVGEYWGR